MYGLKMHSPATSPRLGRKSDTPLRHSFLLFSITVVGIATTFAKCRQTAYAFSRCAVIVALVSKN
jgi:hypothetical protein